MTEHKPGMAGKHGDDMSVCPGPCPSHDPYTPHPAEPKPGSFEDKAARYPGHINLITEADAPAHVHCGVSGHTDPGEDDLPTGWALYHDGGLVFSVDSDKWETIGPGVNSIMTDGDGTEDERNAKMLAEGYVPESDGQYQKFYTRAHVLAALNEAANLTGELMNPSGYESSESIAADSSMDMVVNLTGYLLDHPGATVDEAILANWADKREEDESDEELVERVKEWLL